MAASSTSAQYSLTIRVEIEHRPGMLGKVASAIGEAGGTIGSVDLVALEGGHTLRDINVDTAGDEHGREIVAAIDASRCPGRRLHRPHAAHARRRQDRAAQQAPAAHSRRPLHGLHPRCRPRLHGHPRRPRPRLPVHDQAQPEIVADDELRDDYIVPSVFNRDVAAAVADAVAAEAKRHGTATAAGDEVGYAPGETSDFRAIDV